MEELKALILEYLEKQNQKNKRKKDDILQALHIESALGFVQVEKALEELENDLLVVRGEGNAYSTRRQAGYVESKISINTKGVGYIDLENGESYRIDPEDQLDAMDGDIVLADIRKEKVLQIIKHNKTHLVGTYEDNGHGLHLTLDDEKMKDKPFGVNRDRSFRPVDGLKVLCRIESYGKRPVLSIERVIGHKDDPGVDILAILLDKGIDPVFPDEAMEQADAVPQEVLPSEKEGRTDLTDELFITIDGDDSKDFDDAVSCVRKDNGYVLKVSIADVSHYVQAGTPLDAEALARGCSTYAVNTVVPMLPHVLSNGICSLNPHVERLTITVEMNVSEAGVVEDYKIYPSVICSKERMTYRNVNKMLEGDEEVLEKYAHLKELIEALRDCADAVRVQRRKKGAIDFASTEPYFTFDEDGKVLNVEPRVLGHAEDIIEDCMISANVCVANFLKWQEIPAIYRIHESPKYRKLRDFISASETMGYKMVVGRGPIYATEIQKYLDMIRDKEIFTVANMLLLRCMQKARYEARCIGHFGLGEDEYLHFTSPIRRYPDLIVHRMLRKYSFEKNMNAAERAADERRCADYAQQSSVRERVSQDAEYACEDIKKAEYMASRIGMSAEGIINGVTSYGFYVQLPDTVEGLVRIHSLTDDFYDYDKTLMQFTGETTGKVYKMGMKVKVTVLSVDEKSGKIDFTIGKPAPKRPKGPVREMKTRQREQRRREFGGHAGKGDRNGRKRKDRRF